MDVNQLRYFKKVAELEHITRAAEELMVAQPALSKTIKLLEKEVGVKLFDRKGKNIFLNEKGRVLLKYTNEILTLMDNIKVEIDDLAKKENKTVKVSIQAATRLMPQLILGFKKKYPEIKVIIVQQDFEEGSDLQSDLYIYSTCAPLKKENGITLLEEECLLGLPENHKLAREKVVKIKDLKNEDFLILQNKMPLSQITKYCCRHAGFEPNIILECDSMSTFLAFIEIGMGIAFIPSVTWDCSGHPSVRLLKVDSEKNKRYINICWREKQYLSNSAQLFREFVVEFFEELRKEKP